MKCVDIEIYILTLMYFQTRMGTTYWGNNKGKGGGIMRRKEKEKLIEDYVTIYRLMVVYKKYTLDSISPLDKMYNLTLKLKDRIEEIIFSKKLNDTSYLVLKEQLDFCLKDYNSSTLQYDEEKYIETLISIGENLQKYAKV